MGKSAKAEVEVTATSRTLGAKLREARAKFANFGRELKANVFGKDLVEKGFWGKGGAQLVGNLGSSAVQGGLGFLADQAKGVFQYNDALTRLQITAEQTPEQMAAFSTQVKAASNEVGIGREKILAASSAYVALTGDMDTAKASTQLWAEVAQATNSNIDDISKTAAALSQNSKVGPDDMRAAFAALAVEGKKGAIELKDLAAQMSTIAPQWAMFKGGTGVQGVKELGAALQIVKRGFGGDASETVTGLQSLLTAVVKNSKRFKAAGVQIFDPKDPQHMRNLLDIVNDIANSKLVKNPTKLEKAFGRVEAYRAFLQLKENKGALDDLIASSGDVGVIQRDLTTYMQSDAGRLAKSWENMKNAVAEAFTPERINAFVNAVEGLATKMGPVVDAVGKVGSVLGGIYGAGQALRGLGDKGHQQYSEDDRIILGEGKGSFYDKLRYQQVTAGMSKEEIANRQNAAFKNNLQVDTFNKTVDAIMSKEKDDHATDASVEQAVRAYYNGEGDSAVNRGKMRAAQAYLENSSVNPQQYVADKFGAAGKAALPELMNEIKNLGDAIKVLAALNPTVKVGGDTIVKAHKEAPINRMRPRG